MAVQVTVADGRRMERHTFTSAHSASYETMGTSDKFPKFRTMLILRDAEGRILASYPKCDVLQVDVTE